MGDVDETSTTGVSRSKISNNNNDDEMYFTKTHQRSIKNILKSNGPRIEPLGAMISDHKL